MSGDDAGKCYMDPGYILYNGITYCLVLEVLSVSEKRYDDTKYEVFLLNTSIGEAERCERTQGDLVASGFDFDTGNLFN